MRISRVGLEAKLVFSRFVSVSLPLFLISFLLFACAGCGGGGGGGGLIVGGSSGTTSDTVIVSGQLQKSDGSALSDAVVTLEDAGSASRPDLLSLLLGKESRQTPELNQKTAVTGSDGKFSISGLSKNRKFKMHITGDGIQPTTGELSTGAATSVALDTAIKIPAQADGAPYVNPAKGTTWTWSYLDNAGKTGTMVGTMGDTKTLSNGKTVRELKFTLDGQQVEVDYVHFGKPQAVELVEQGGATSTEARQGLWFYGYLDGGGSVEFVKPQFWLPLGAIPLGAKYKGVVGVSEASLTNYTVETGSAKEKITYADRDWDVTKLTTTYDNPPSASTSRVLSKVQIWYHPGLGPVKYVSTYTNGFEFTLTLGAFKLTPTETYFAFSGTGTLTSALQGTGIGSTTTTTEGTTTNTTTGVTTTTTGGTTTAGSTTSGSSLQLVKELTINAASSWQSIGVTLDATKSYVITASGSTGDVGSQPYGPNGYGADGAILHQINSNAPFPYLPHMSLIGKLDNGSSFYVGSMRILREKSGTLSLALNDNPGVLGDNTGSLSVKIYQGTLNANDSAVPNLLASIRPAGGHTAHNYQKLNLVSELTVNGADILTASAKQVTLQAGRLYLIESFGSTGISSGDTWYPLGYIPWGSDENGNPDHPFPATPHMALIGKSSKLGTQNFYIGAQCVLDGDSYGTVTLGINDSVASDNTGSYTVRVWETAYPGAQQITGYSFDTKWSATYPVRLAVDAAGNVYVCLYTLGKINKYSGTGSLLATIGSPGAGDGQFSNPQGIAFDANGNFYVVDRGNSRIQKFNSSGAFLTKWGSSGSGNGQFNTPLGIDVDGNGNVYVLEWGNSRVQKFDGNGNYLTKWGSSGSGDGQFTSPYGMAVDNAGNVYVVDDAHRLQKFSSTGQFLTKWGSLGSGDGQFNLPRAVAIDANGNIFVGEDGGLRIQKFNQNGVFQVKWGSQGTLDGQFLQMMDVAVDANGNVYTADADGARIEKFKPTP
ncbi:MAG: hypothetical protein HYU64_05805 [Armatimonadetes bacterium]|nr:hypothetical protein [Armatimonadota bacterium]